MSMSASRASRAYDMIVYGATGFTGKKVAQYLLQSHPEIRLSISGRNRTKLLAVAKELNLSPNHVLPASAGDLSNLISTLSQAHIVIACAGPYRQIGETIVRAAIESQTHYLDLCGEPQFFDDMLAKYDEKARNSDTLIVSACAFDCVPADLSAALASLEMKERYGIHTPVTNLEVVHTFDNISVGNTTTFHAAVDGFHAAMTGELQKSREHVQRVLKLSPNPKRPREWPVLVEAPGNTPLYHPETDQYLLKFPGADAACILASHRYLRHRTALEATKTASATPADNPSQLHDIDPHPRMSVSFGVPSKIAAYKVIAYGAVFSTLARFQYGCQILHDNPGRFTNGFFKDGGPSQEELNRASFTTYTKAYGKNENQCVKVTVDGPEPGYVATPRIIVALALMVLRHGEKLRYKGGVCLPGVLFGGSGSRQVYDLLMSEGVKFEVVVEDKGDKGGSDQNV